MGGVDWSAAAAVIPQATLRLTSFTSTTKGLCEKWSCHEGHVSEGNLVEGQYSDVIPIEVLFPCKRCGACCRAIATCSRSEFLAAATQITEGAAAVISSSDTCPKLSTDADRWPPLRLNLRTPEGGEQGLVLSEASSGGATPELWDGSTAASSGRAEGLSQHPISDFGCGEEEEEKRKTRGDEGLSAAPLSVSGGDAAAATTPPAAAATAATAVERRQQRGGQGTSHTDDSDNNETTTTTATTESQQSKPNVTDKTTSRSTILFSVSVSLLLLFFTLCKTDARRAIDSTVAFWLSTGGGGVPVRQLRNAVDAWWRPKIELDSTTTTFRAESLFNCNNAEDEYGDGIGRGCVVSGPSLPNSCDEGDSVVNLDCPYPAVRLRRHGQRQFSSPRIFAVAPFMSVAVGYGLANSVFICTDEGLVVIDTLESRRAMTEALEAFWHAVTNNSTLPAADADHEPLELHACKALPLRSSSGREGGKKTLPKVPVVIYSHFHSDHVSGAAALYGDETHDDVQIWSHELTAARISTVITQLAGTTYKRAMRQFGNFLDPLDFANAGIGQRLRYDSEEDSGLLVPTHTFKKSSKSLNVGGLTLELHFAPGESNDQIVVWLPEHKILYGADNIYRAFPNIYPLRGEESRDPLQWVNSLEKMRDFQADTLVLGHTKPVVGRSYIAGILTDYRDAILFVHDQTVRHLNNGILSPDEIVESVVLPQRLKGHPFLQEFYGTVAWSVRGIITRYIGWFSGAASDLDPLPAREKAKRLVKLLGGKEALAAAAKDALRHRDFQWCLELLKYSLAVSPADSSLLRAQHTALRLLAAHHSAASGYNWLQTAALESQDKQVSPGFGRSAQLTRASVASRMVLSEAQKSSGLSRVTNTVDTLDLFPGRWMTEQCVGVDFVALIHFVDENRDIVCVHFREAAVIPRPQCERPPDVELWTRGTEWRRILMRKLSPFGAIVTRKLGVWPASPSVLFSLRKSFSCVDKS